MQEKEIIINGHKATVNVPDSWLENTKMNKKELEKENRRLRKENDGLIRLMAVLADRPLVKSMIKSMKEIKEGKIRRIK